MWDTYPICPHIGSLAIFSKELLNSMYKIELRNVYMHITIITYDTIYITLCITLYGIIYGINMS